MSVRCCRCRPRERTRKSPGCELVLPLSSHGYWPRLISCNSNIWSPGSNRDVVKRIASQYKFSTRMLETILGWDLARAKVKESLHNDKIRRKSAQHTRSPGEDVQSPRFRPSFLRSPDPEKGISIRGGAAGAKPAAPSRGFHQEDIEMYKLLQSQYNYTTIDHGSNCKCIAQASCWRQSLTGCKLSALEQIGSTTGRMWKITQKSSRMTTRLMWTLYHPSTGPGMF